MANQRWWAGNWEIPLVPGAWEFLCAQLACVREARSGENRCTGWKERERLEISSLCGCCCWGSAPMKRRGRQDRIKSSKAKRRRLRFTIRSHTRKQERPRAREILGNHHHLWTSSIHSFLSKLAERTNGYILQQKHRQQNNHLASCNRIPQLWWEKPPRPTTTTILANTIQVPQPFYREQASKTKKPKTQHTAAATNW